MTPPQDPRARRRAETHRRLYLAAMELFREQGFEAVTVARIASAARVSVPTFYDHFPSKEHIVLPLPEPAEIEQVMAEQPATLPLGERVRGGIFSWFGSIQGRDRDELLERWRIVVTSPGLRTRAATFERATAEMVLEAVAPDRHEGPPPVGPGVVVSATLSAYTQILVRWAEEEGRRSLEEIAEEVLAALRQL
ncbi:TetR/AcrR family transcriptional regulator [Geodermatophilus ruber]|uniref:Transcriptional regulator, TetR family n=1 Tax=Geodermatophilus ruber TaxID=504800 RepID=A0A1I4JAL9_9ACTN|nr:TetR/AcrR family transcriptional regulator [Geodermatophilus ruber]SFL63580.1 transcriptional regulator, TetR family [Geodermatophilus ruber]